MHTLSGLRILYLQPIINSNCKITPNPKKNSDNNKIFALPSVSTIGAPLCRPTAGSSSKMR